MSFSLLPDHKFRWLTDISPDFLKGQGKELLLLDLDNTISPYKTERPEEAVLKWADIMKSSGIKLFIVSNNRGSRPEIFSEAMGVGYIKNAKKPLTSGIEAALKINNAERSAAALVGDQIYTDVIAANSAGIMSILVEPIKFTNVLLALRYVLELPFRREKRS